MGSILALLIIVLIAWLLVKLGTGALVMTGMSEPVAKFQAASAFFGVGFTTKEAELVVNHPVRRRIILHLIIAGNIGLTSALATLLVTFVGNSDQGLGLTFVWLGLAAIGAVAIGLLMNLKVVKGPLTKLMEFSLRKSGLTSIRNYDHLLNLTNGYCLEGREIGSEHPWIGKCLWETRPSDQGVVILGIYRTGGGFEGAPKRDTMVEEEDVLMVYGKEEDLKEAFAVSE